MVIATPFDKKGCFYYNRKINCLKAQGFYSLNGEKKPINGFGVLDWGRGVWTYSNTWYWSSLSCKSNDLTVGFNLGYGFGNTSAAISSTASKASPELTPGACSPVIMAEVNRL